MKPTCDIIRDLLPLYAEDLASVGSRRLVDAHLEECESCQMELRLLRTPAHIPQEEPGIDTVRREIGRRRALAVSCAVLLLCAVLCWAANWLTSPIYLDESVITDVVDNGDGTVTLFMDAAAVGRKTFQFELEAADAGEVFAVWTSHWLELKWREPVPRELEITRSVIHNGVYYFTGREGEENLLIYENPQKFITSGIMDLPRLFLSLYFEAALIAGAVLLAAAWFFRREKFAKYLGYLGSLSLSYALCQGLICGFTFVSFFAQQEFAWALVMAVCLWGAGLCGWKMRKRP